MVAAIVSTLLFLGLDYATRYFADIKENDGAALQSAINKAISAISNRNNDLLQTVTDRLSALNYKQVSSAVQAAVEKEKEKLKKSKDQIGKVNDLLNDASETAVEYAQRVDRQNSNPISSIFNADRVYDQGKKKASDIIQVAKASLDKVENQI